MHIFVVNLHNQPVVTMKLHQHMICSLYSPICWSGPHPGPPLLCKHVLQVYVSMKCSDDVTSALMKSSKVQTLGAVALHTIYKNLHSIRPCLGSVDVLVCTYYSLVPKL